MPKSAQNPRPAQHPARPAKSAWALEQLLAERFGVPAVRVTVRGTPPDWSATLIANRVGNAERHAAFWRLVHDTRAEFDLAEE